MGASRPRSDTATLEMVGSFLSDLHAYRAFSSAHVTLPPGNLHINIVAKDWDKKVEQTIEPWIYEATGQSRGG